MAKTHKRPLNQTEIDLLVDLTVKGVGILDICKQLRIRHADFYGMMETDSALDSAYRNARAAYFHSQVDQLTHLGNDAESMVDVQKARLKSDNIKWAASKVVPSVYGDNINLNVNQTFDLGPVLQAAAGRIVPLLEAKKSLTTLQESARPVLEAARDVEIVETKEAREESDAADKTSVDDLW